MSITNFAIEPKVVLRWYIDKLKYLVDNDIDFYETNSVRGHLRAYLETLALSKDTIKEINCGLLSLYKLQIEQIDYLDSELALDNKYVKDVFNQLIKSLSILVEQPLPILYKNNANSSNKLKKPTPNTKRNLIKMLEVIMVVKWIIEFFHR